VATRPALERTRLDCAAVLISRRVRIGAGGLVEKDTKTHQAGRIALDKGGGQLRAKAGKVPFETAPAVGGQTVSCGRAQCGIRSTVGLPTVVAGRFRGNNRSSTTEPDPLPDGTWSRLADFTEF
jgi:hypothetical protein